ncbi:hypothetical protein AAH340_004195 [Escherichia coli]|uniref:hypothetical protein n=1 Tax=Escherichia coli TaxID=562 RepID=UPI000A90BCA3|nr:hypothetical protein [Escherichia coli]EED1239266.1 hypothetical protein [Escherichia coli]EER8921199.1 hypothetical protein [Escherichia coli]EER8988195.1 hypothetical protein [Escherichia coli]EET5989228.1 hypothetical protein [Escherichia coli]EET7495287.1 hypothetical protein [Escherichia coli]
MAELTKEQLIEEAKLKIAITKCHPNSGMARIEGELFKIALASLEAEPVAWKATFTQIDHEYNTFTAMYSDKAEAKRWVRLHKVGDFRAEITPLYAASPALVVPDKLPREYIRGWPLAYSDYAEGWNDCREAMLQSGSFRENKDSSTNNFRKISETSTNSPVIPGEVLSAILKFAKVRADFDDFDGDRRGISDCLDEAEQELIVTINKHASQIAAKPSQEEKSGNADCTATSGKTDNPQASGKQVNELTMLVKRLASSLKSVNKSSNLPDKAMEYLKQNGLVGVEDVLR